MSSNDPSWPTGDDDGEQSTPPPSAPPTPPPSEPTPPASDEPTSPPPNDPTAPTPGEPATPPPSTPTEPSPTGAAVPPPAPDATPPAPGPAPAPAPAPAGGTAGATLGVRFVARLIDGLIVGIASLVISFLPGLDGVLISGIIGAALFIGYYGYLDTTQGATFGKQAMSLKVRGADGGNPTWEESIKRNIWGTFQIVPILGGLASLVAVIGIAITINSAPDNRGFHDGFAGTTVVKV